MTNRDYPKVGYPGGSLFDFYAACALEGILANCEDFASSHIPAKAACTIAKTMMEERKKYMEEDHLPEEVTGALREWYEAHSGEKRTYVHLPIEMVQELVVEVNHLRQKVKSLEE